MELQMEMPIHFLAKDDASSRLGYFSVILTTNLLESNIKMD